MILMIVGKQEPYNQKMKVQKSERRIALMMTKLTTGLLVGE